MANDTFGLGAEPPANARFYVGVINFNADIAAGSNDTKTFNLNSDGDFVVTHITGVFWITAALASSVVGTPLTYDASQSSSSNTVPNHAMIALQFTSNDWQWFSAPVRANLLLADGRNRNWWLQTPRLLRQSSTQALCVNNAAVAVQGQIALHGYRVP